MDKITVTRENFWDAAEQLRSNGFGFSIGTHGYTQYQIYLIFWLDPQLKIKPIEGNTPILVLQQAIDFARDFLELRQFLYTIPDPESSA